MYWGLRTLGEPKIPANPLLHKCSTEAARETHAETGEPKDVYVDGITWRFEYVKGRSGHSVSTGDPREFLSNLSKKRGGHVCGIGLEVFVTFDKKCSDRRRKYTRLQTDFQR
jgi:hypothetical protein